MNRCYKSVLGKICQTKKEQSNHLIESTCRDKEFLYSWFYQEDIDWHSQSSSNDETCLPQNLYTKKNKTENKEKMVKCTCMDKEFLNFSVQPIRLSQLVFGHTAILMLIFIPVLVSDLRPAEDFPHDLLSFILDG